jgi:RNA polymerase sigma-70 factor (ECF subfamily)
MDFRARLTAEIPYLRRFARGLTGDVALADDLAQDCLERALAKEHLYDPARPLRAWLYAILRNLHVSGLRRKGRAGVVKNVDDLAPEEEAVAGEQEDHAAVRSIAEALDRLPHLHREVVLLVALEDMSYREVAEIIGAPVGTVMSRLSRARSALRTMLEMSGRPSLRRVK